MRSAKSLILPLALLLSSTSVAAQLSKDDLTELDTLAADENGESTATQEEAEEAVKEPAVKAETPADETMSGGSEGLLAKLASRAAEGNGEARSEKHTDEPQYLNMHSGDSCYSSTK